MSKRLKKLIPLALLSFFFFIFASVFIFQNEKKQIKKDIVSELHRNSINIKSYFLNAESLVYSLKYTIEDKLNLDCCIHPAYDSYEYNSNTNLFEIVNFSGLKAIDLSRLTAKGNPDDYHYKKRLEIISALHLKPIFNAAIEIIPDLKWVYYTSANDFIYISPNYKFKDAKNLLEQYNLAFWQEAIPKNNPSRNLVITDLYEDGAGKGLMTTLSIPVFQEEEFKGIVSIDIGVNTLNNLLPNIGSIGKTFLIDEKNQIISSKSTFKLGETKKKEIKDDIEIDVITGQIKLLYIIDESKLYKEALYNSSGKITILFLLIIISFIAIYLKILLTKVQYYANTDALTKLLNRRAMQGEIGTQINISRRYEQELSFLLIDLDFFKKINDKYGHQIGDKVLIEVAKLFKRNTRNSDIIARYGGEEFLIGLANTSLEKAFILAERIRVAVQKIKIDHYNINLTISIGCTKLKDNDNFFSILTRVDKLLYKAKKAGRNCTVKEEEN